MKMRLLRAGKVRQLSEDIASNLDKYRNGDFGFVEVDPSSYFQSEHDIDENKLAEVACTESDHQEVENCERLHEGMNGLSLYLGRDERIWVYLVHTLLLDYSRTRWPIPENDDKAVQHIRNHFFVAGGRGFERDNSASRLWWMATLCRRARGMTLHDALTSLLYQYDVRANIIERPTTSQNVRVFSAVLGHLHRSFRGDKALFEREKFRGVMKELNLRGGTTLLDALEDSDLDNLVTSCMS